jgi:GNAT superfamily N-acetyltransferase
VTVKKRDELQGDARAAMSFTVRHLVPADLDALGDAFAPAPYEKERAQYERYLAEHQAGSRVTLLARAQAGTVIGYVNLLWHSDYSGFAEADIPEINDLNVIIPWRRRGVGTALITAAEAAARDAGRRRVGIGVGMTPDYDAARRLYPALGYLRDGFGPSPTAYGDAEYLTKELPPSAPESQ